ncbi:MAG: hypothetical protein EOP14_04270, partial [Pseudomonas sp.]
VDTVLAGKTTREGDKQLRLLPENFDSLSPKDQETAIDEGISRLMEAEVLRPRKGGGVRELPAGIISNNLSALSRVAGDKSVGKFRAFIRAVRAHFGLAIDRASEIRRGLEDGTISREDYEAYLSKLHGIAIPKTHNQANADNSKSFSFGKPAERPDGTRDTSNAPEGAVEAESSLPDQTTPAARSVARLWNALATHDDLFQSGRTDSSDASEIAAEVSRPGRLITAEDGGHYVRFDSDFGYLTIREANSPTPYISAVNAGSQGRSGGAGSLLYVAALDWIHNNNKKIKDDPSGLTPINAIRRTSNFFASALRWGTTKHLLPHQKQKVEGWNEDHDNNLYLLAVREMENVHKSIPESRHWTFDFESGRFLDSDGKDLQQSDRTERVVFADPGDSGIGLSTLQRAVITASAIQALRRGSSEDIVASAVSRLPASIRGTSYSLGPATPPRLTTPTFKSAIIDLIGEEQLRTVQPNVPYEDKVKLIDDFARSVLREGPSPESQDSISPDDESRDWDYSTPDIGQPGGIQVLEQRLANDLLIDTQVRFLGETVQSAEDLAVKAMAIRNPMFETFYIFALKPDPNSDPDDQKMIVADVMALTSRVPCASNPFVPVHEWREGIEHHATFLDASGATDFMYLHNHPSGDPEPSDTDRFVTKKLSEMMADKKYRFHGHVVINHKAFSRIDEEGKVHRGTIPDSRIKGTPYEFDAFAWPRNSSTIGVKVSDGASIARLAHSLEERKSKSDQIIGLITNTRSQTVAVVVGTEQQFNTLTREQLRVFARDQGGARLYIHAKAESKELAADLLSRFEEMNYYDRLFDMTVEYTNLNGTGGYLSGRTDGQFRQIPEFFGDSNTRDKTEIIQYSAPQ